EAFKKDKQVVEIVNSLKEDAQETLTSLRDSIWSLHQSEISIIEFADHAERYLQSTLKYLPHITYKIKNEAKSSIAQLGPMEALNLTRAMQESIQNIIKHAGASEITIQMTYAKGAFSINISDNGRGFTPGKTMGEHYGIDN